MSVSQGVVVSGRSGGRGYIDIEGLQEMIDALDRGIAELPNAIRTTLKGEGGEVLVIIARGLVHNRTFFVSEHIGITESGGAVLVGFNDDADHIGTWLESGVSRHSVMRNSRAVNATQRKTARMGLHGTVDVVDGHPYSRVESPGFGGQKIMRKTLRIGQAEFESALVDVLIRTRWAQEGSA